MTELKKGIAIGIVMCLVFGAIVLVTYYYQHSLDQKFLNATTGNFSAGALYENNYLISQINQQGYGVLYYFDQQTNYTYAIKIKATNVTRVN